jgi:hypothetical protein
VALSDVAAGVEEAAIEFGVGYKIIFLPMLLKIKMRNSPPANEGAVWQIRSILHGFRQRIERPGTGIGTVWGATRTGWR